MTLITTSNVYWDGKPVPRAVHSACQTFLAFMVSTLTFCSPSALSAAWQLFAVEKFQKPSVPPNPKRKQEGQLTNRYDQLGAGDVNNKHHQRPVWKFSVSLTACLLLLQGSIFKWHNCTWTMCKTERIKTSWSTCYISILLHHFISEKMECKNTGNSMQRL